jgi:TPR repeat protein
LAPHSDQESYAEAKRYLDAKEYTKALPLLITAANAGNTESMYKLGDLYRNGSDVAPDYKKSRDLYETAAADAGPGSPKKVAEEALERLHSPGRP